MNTQRARVGGAAPPPTPPSPGESTRPRSVIAAPSPQRRRVSVAPALALLAALAAAPLAGCAPSDVIALQLVDHGGLDEGASVSLDSEVIGAVAHIRFSRDGGAAVAELELQPTAFARLDPDTIWAVRAPADDAKPAVVASNLCVDTPRGLPPRADVRGHGGPLHRQLPAIAAAHADCIARKGGGYGPIRAILGAPAGLGAATQATPTGD